MVSQKSTGAVFFLSAAVLIAGCTADSPYTTSRSQPETRVAAPSPARLPEPQSTRLEDFKTIVEADFRYDPPSFGLERTKIIIQKGKEFNPPEIEKVLRQNPGGGLQMAFDDTSFDSAPLSLKLEETGKVLWVYARQDDGSLTQLPETYVPFNTELLVAVIDKYAHEEGERKPWYYRYFVMKVSSLPPLLEPKYLIPNLPFVLVWQYATTYVESR